MAYQLAAVVSTAAVSFGFTIIILLAIKYTIGLRIYDTEHEIVGMDQISHNEEGYNFKPLLAKPAEVGVTTDGYKFQEEMTSNGEEIEKKFVPPGMLMFKKIMALVNKKQ